MPLQRILSAADWREEHIPVLSHIGIAKVNQALAKLTRWVLQFNRMITFYVCATEEDLESASLSIFTIVNERKIKKRRKKDSEKLLKGSGSKKMLHRGNSKIDIVRSESKRNLNRVGSKQAIQHSESVKDMRPANFINVDRESVNMHELITRNASTSFSKDHEECGSALTEIDFVSAAKEYEQSESSKSPLRDPILGRRRVSVVSQIIQKDKRKLSNKSTEEKGQESSDAFGVDVPELEERLAAFPKSAAPVHTEPNFEAQFWKSIGAAFMLDDKGQIILSNGKDIALYQDMLLGDETVTSDYSKQKLSGSDLALTTRRRKIVAANRDLIHNYVGLLIRQASNEYASSTTKKG